MTSWTRLILNKSLTASWLQAQSNQAGRGISKEWRSRTAPETVPNPNTIYYNEEQGRGWVDSFGKKTNKETKHLLDCFHTVGHTRWGQGWLLHKWDQDAAGDKVGPGLPAGVLAGVWDLSSSRREQRWKHISSDLEALSTGWRVDVFFACFGLVMGLWLGDAPVSGLPSTLWFSHSTLWVSHLLGMGGHLCDHFRYFCFNWPLLAFISAYSKYCAWARLYLTSNPDHFLGFVHFGFEVWGSTSKMFCKEFSYPRKWLGEGRDLYNRGTKDAESKAQNIKKPTRSILLKYWPFHSHYLLQISIKNKIVCVFCPFVWKHLREKQCKAGI